MRLYVHTDRCLVVVNVIDNGLLMWRAHGYSLMAFKHPYAYLTRESERQLNSKSFYMFQLNLQTGSREVLNFLTIAYLIKYLIKYLIDYS